LIVDESGDLEASVTPSDIFEALLGGIPGSAEADQRVMRRTHWAATCWRGSIACRWRQTALPLRTIVFEVADIDGRPGADLAAKDKGRR
jgi:Mg2+/Co2+ transporter CorB